MHLLGAQSAVTDQARRHGDATKEILAMRVFVTGASGHIASAVMPELVR
jgi:hypothetical protein